MQGMTYSVQENQGMFHKAVPLMVRRLKKSVGKPRQKKQLVQSKTVQKVAVMFYVHQR